MAKTTNGKVTLRKAPARSSKAKDNGAARSAPKGGRKGGSGLENEMVANLILEALEHEMGGELVYRTAIECAQNPQLHKEWKKYLRETQHHTQVLRQVCKSFGLDPDQETPGRRVVRHVGKSLVKAMQLALGSGTPEAAELVAAECVTVAETKDHLNWELLGKVAETMTEGPKQQLQKAYDSIEDQEDEHLYHTAGWSRELWLQALGLPSQLPPPEEKDDVHTAEEAARSQKKSESKRK
jgi:hypothetical protein